MSADDFDIETAILAGDLLEQTWGEPVRVLRGEILKSGRFAKVYRLSFSQAPENALGTVVVKRILIPDDAGSRPEDQVGSRQRFQNEWAGLTLLSSIESTCALVPTLIAARQEAGIVVMDDVIGNATLDQLLLGADPDAAKQGLLDMCVTLAVLHAGTSNLKQQYESAIAEGGPAVVSPPPAQQCRHSLESVRDMAVALGVNAPRGLDDEIEGLESFFHGDGAFIGLLHNDACPDNFVTTDSGMKVWDFGFSSFGQFLVDGVYARMLFPSCWCVNRIPAGVLNEMEANYRQQLATVIPEAKDDKLYGQKMVEACAHLVTDMLFQGLPDAKRLWGTATMGQRFVARFEAFADTAEQFGHMTTTGELFGRMAEALRTRWLDTDLDLPLFPAFDKKE
ncbi:MAG: hypothetical protein V3T51_05310 [Gammaproteobacteria bacterium]